MILQRYLASTCCDEEKKMSFSMKSLEIVLKRVKTILKVRINIEFWSLGDFFIRLIIA